MTSKGNNSIVSIDLSGQSVSWVEILPEDRKKYIGGAGMNTKILYESGAMHSDPLSEKNVLIFGVGPAVGTGMISANRCTVSARSPLTGIYGDSNVGGAFTVAMRGVGIDNLVFTGKSEKPVYVYIKSSGEISFLNAEDLWGTWTDKLTERLQERHPGNIEIACIGPAGEKLVRFASVIMSEVHVAGRMGMGCVMGSKNLKAIVIEKNEKNKPYVYDSNKLMKLNQSWLKAMKASVPAKLSKMDGTLFLLEMYNKDRCLPVKNFQEGSDKEVRRISSAAFKNDHMTKRTTCFACPVACGKKYEIKEGKYKGEKGERLDYGAAASVGPALGIFDWPDIIHLKLLTDYLGLDTIELSGVLGMVLECQERGILKKDDLDGGEYSFGNADDIEYLMNKIVNREGIGDLMAEGTYRTAKALNVEEYAFCIKKAATGLNSNARLALSLGYITSTRAGDHLKSFPFTHIMGGGAPSLLAKHIFKVDTRKLVAKPEKKGRVVWWHENYKYAADSLGFCYFALPAIAQMGVALFDDLADIMNALFNLEINDEDVFYASERIYQMQNAFNVICGMNVDEYKWPVRKKDSNIDQGLIDLTTIKVRDNPEMLPEYFKYRGLTSEGKPTVQRFKELNLDAFIKEGEMIDSENVEEMKSLLNGIKLSAKFSIPERLIGQILSGLLSKLLDLKEKGESKKYLQMKNASKVQ